jgi:hypothetical protein
VAAAAAPGQQGLLLLQALAQLLPRPQALDGWLLVLLKVVAQLLVLLQALDRLRPLLQVVPRLLVLLQVLLRLLVLLQVLTQPMVLLQALARLLVLLQALAQLLPVMLLLHLHQETHGAAASVAGTSQRATDHPHRASCHHQPHSRESASLRPHQPLPPLLLLLCLLLTQHLRLLKAGCCRLPTRACRVLAAAE